MNHKEHKFQKTQFSQDSGEQNLFYESDDSETKTVKQLHEISPKPSKRELVQEIQKEAKLEKKDGAKQAYLKE